MIISQKKLIKEVFFACARAFTIYIFAALICTPVFTAAKAYAGVDVISVDELIELIASGKNELVIADVSPDISYKEEHIEGAVNMPLEKIYAISKSFSKKVLFITYCHCGGESASAKDAAEKLTAQGFKSVKYLGKPNSAYNAYKEKGYPLTIDPRKYVPVSGLRTAAGTQVLKYNDFSSISPEELYELIQKSSFDVIVIDVRERAEYEKGRITDAVNIPLGELFVALKNGALIDRLNSKSKIVIYCATSARRAEIASEELIKKGYEGIYILTGGYEAWVEKGYSAYQGK